MSTCAQCARRAADRLWPIYSMACVTCCARLVRSARPLRHAQEAHFAVITRQPGRPDKAAVINEIKRIDALAL